jgi:hypothetical protein
MSVAQASAILGVSPDAAKPDSPDRSAPYVRKARKCGKWTCAHDATVIFKNGRAVAISLYDVGP